MFYLIKQLERDVMNDELIAPSTIFNFWDYIVFQPFINERFV